MVAPKFPEAIPATMKCKWCGETKDLNSQNFQPRKKRKFGFVSRCRACLLDDAANRYRLNTEFIRELKSVTPCADCGHTYHFAAMDFDHLPGSEKHKQISKLMNLSFKSKVIMDELAKCELVCANCHRVRTWERHPHKVVMNGGQ